MIKIFNKLFFNKFKTILAEKCNKFRIYLYSLINYI